MYRLFSYHDGFTKPLDYKNEFEALKFAREFMRAHSFSDAWLQKERAGEWKTVCRIQITKEVSRTTRVLAEAHQEVEPIGW